MRHCANGPLATSLPTSRNYRACALPSTGHLRPKLGLQAAPLDLDLALTNDPGSTTTSMLASCPLILQRQLCVSLLGSVEGW
jgi:hypothetical protein